MSRLSTHRRAARQNSQTRRQILPNPALDCDQTLGLVCALSQPFETHGQAANANANANATDPIRSNPIQSDPS